MSSLKGQLANMEGSVKTMKMAVVVGSVLTVACLAAVFGVTILANEVSKETKVSNGALVNRNGATVATASMSQNNMRDAMLAGKVNVGDVIAMPIEGGMIECAVEKMLYKNGEAAAFCSDVSFAATPTQGNIAVVVQEGSLFTQVESITSIEDIQNERNLQNPGLCFALKAVVSMVEHGMTLGAVISGEISIAEGIANTLMGMAWGKVFGLGCFGDAMTVIGYIVNGME